MTDSSERLSEALVRFADRVDAIVGRLAGSLLRYETLDDLAQGVRLRVLERAGSFRWSSDAEFVGWAQTVARSYLNDRRAYWNAARRNAGHVLRVSLAGGSGSAPGGVDPPTLGTGPATFADRRDQLDLAIAAMATLLARDRAILELERQGEGTAAIAAALGLSHESAGKARQRAHERFRRAFGLLLRAK